MKLAKLSCNLDPGMVKAHVRPVDKAQELQPVPVCSKLE
jgi:hypothetical protein